MAENEGKKPEVDPARAMSAQHKPVQGKQPGKERPKVEPLEGVTAKKVKPPLGNRIRQAFTNDSAQSVGDYLLFDVAIPAIKATLFDLIQNGASRTLFGSGLQNNSPSRGGRIDYNRISRGQGVVVQPSAPGQPQVVGERNTFNFDGIIFPTRAGAERALTAMLDTLETYGIFAVADLYELVNITGSWSDSNYGWFNLNGATIEPVRNGFILDLPPVQPLR
jgi:hypothetical protein